jgi:hypothetical protein
MRCPLQLKMRVSHYYTNSVLKYIHLVESSEVVNLQVNSINNSTLVISWELPTHPNGAILNYSVSIIDLRNGGMVRQKGTVSTNITFVDLGMCNNEPCS